MEKTAMLTIMEKKALLDRIESVIESLEHDRVFCHQSYEAIGTSDEQATDWQTNELLWEDVDKTIPKYKKIYAFVDKTELDDNDKAKIKAIDTIIDVLLKMI